MTTLQTAALAIVLWQILAFCIFLFSKQSDESLVVAIFVPWAVSYVVLKILGSLWLTYCKRHLYRYSFGWADDGGKEFISCNIFYTTERWAKKMCRRGEGKYFIEFVSDCKNFKSAPRFKEVYRGQKSFQGWADMSRFFWGGGNR